MNPPPLPVQKRFPWILYWIVFVLIVLFAFAPMGSVVACGLIANAHGCRVDEGSVHPCVINGKDYGQLLYTLGVMGWLMLVTLPVGAFAFILWLIVLLVHRSSWRKQIQSVLKVMNHAYKNCQSCGMPLKRDEKGGGTNADGTQSTLYCSHCYQNGQFVLPYISVTEMQARVREKIVEFGMPSFLAGIFTSKIPKLARWQKS